MAKSMYEIIKKQNGEHFAKAIRNYDNGIFDIPNIDKIVKYAGRDAEPIMQYLISLKDVKIEEQAVHQDPIRLLDKAGYDAYIADTLEKQNAIQKYYATGERLCTFRDPDRFKNYYIINAVRKDVDKIKRQDFKKPQREDKYGTSVLSIQVLKTGGFISIKNRYNHTVENPDNTFNSNPDNIIIGLSDAIRHHFNVDFSASKVRLPNGYYLIQNKIIKSNSEFENIIFGADFYVKDGHIIELDKNSQLMLGNGFVYDAKSKKILDYVSLATNVSRLMVDADFLKNKKVKIIKNPDGSRSLLADGDIFFTVQDGIMNYINPKGSDVVSLRYFRLRGDYDFSDVKELNLHNADFSSANSLILPKAATKIDLRGVVFPPATVDFSNIKKLDLCDADLTNITKVIFPRNAESIECLHGGLPENAPDIDFSGAKNLTLYSIPNIVKIKNITFPKNAESITCFFGGVRVVLDTMDLGGVKRLSVTQANLSKVRQLILPKNADFIDISKSIMPACDIDFTNVKKFNFSNTDFSRVGGFTMRNTIMVARYDGKCYQPCDINFNGVKRLDLQGSDLTSVETLILPKKAEYINLRGVKLPECDLDLSNVKELILDGADLSRVRSIKLPLHYKMRQGIKNVMQKLTIKYKGFEDAKNKNDTNRR